MSSRDYPRLSIEDFGRHLLTSGDLDPVYIALNAMQMDGEQLARWLLAYWCCYHVGASCWLSERQGDMFWEYLLAAAKNEEGSHTHPNPLGSAARWPRAKERRHWRGENAIQSTLRLTQQYKTALDFVLYVGGQSKEDVGWVPVTAADVMRRVQEHYAFGPWVAYKISDQMETCVGIPVSFTEADAMYEEPVKSAEMLWRQRAGVPEDAKIKDPKRAVSDVVRYLLEHFKDQAAPPRYERRIGLQEIETILCKWKSHVNGHYPLNNDLIEIREGLEPWLNKCSTAAAFNHYLPKVNV